MTQASGTGRHLSHLALARQLAQRVNDLEEGRDHAYFEVVNGLVKPLYKGGSGYGEDRRPELRVRKKADFVIENPHRPSLASCEDLALQFVETDRQVVYDAVRWESDPRVLEQAGPSAFERNGRSAERATLDLLGIFSLDESDR